MKTMRLFTLSVVAAALTFGGISCADQKDGSEGSGSYEELLIGSWHRTIGDDSLKLDQYWHFNDDKTEQLITISSIEDDIQPTVYGTWGINGNVIKTVTLSNKEKNETEWKILKLDRDSLKIEIYDGSNNRFESSFKRINK